jgi:hypothetical protein
VSFDIEPKGRGYIYQKTYPDYYDQLSYPRGYRVPAFSNFSREDGKTKLEYVGQFILQCSAISANDALKLRMFPLSLSDTAFTWFTSLAPNSIFTWAQLEKNSMNTFTLAIPSLDCHIVLQLNKSIMSLSSTTLGNLEILGICVLM